ncbi:MAG TPA: hypothetical protein VJS88_02345, partial [Chthoniobacterales bacterium]|nr:hypothetical protein [Chthoniobacterales bacterium]
MKMQNPIAKIGASLLVTVLLVAATYLLLPKGRSIGAPPTPVKKPVNATIRAEQKRARMVLGQLPLSFETNRGQFPAEVQFASRGAGYKAFFTGSEAVFVLRKPATNGADAAASEKQAIEKINHASRKEAIAELAQLNQEKAARRAASKAVVRMSLENADVAAVTGIDQLDGKINYFRGNDDKKWIRDVPTFRK